MCNTRRTLLLKVRGLQVFSETEVNCRNAPRASHVAIKADVQYLKQNLIDDIRIYIRCSILYMLQLYFYAAIIMIHIQL